MKAFVNELTKEWKSCKNIHGHNKYQNKYILKSLLISINKELIVFSLNLKSNTSFCIFLLMLSIASIAIGINADAVTLQKILDSLITAILALLSVIVAGAVFLTTQSTSTAYKRFESAQKFDQSLTKIDNIFRNTFENVYKSLDSFQNLVLIKAHSAESVVDQRSYEKFATWLDNLQSTHKVPNNFDGNTYQLAVEAYQNRSFFIAEGIKILEGPEVQGTNSTAQLATLYSQQIRDLQTAITSSDTLILNSSFMNKKFLGPRLTRVIFTGVFAIVINNIYQILNNRSFNLVHAYTLHSITLLKVFAVFISFSALVLSLRYILKFIMVLRFDADRLAQNAINFYPRIQDGAYDPWYGHGRG